MSNTDRDYMYPMVLSQKAMKAIVHIGALPIFAKYLNQYCQMEDEKGYVLFREPIATLYGCRQVKYVSI